MFYNSNGYNSHRLAEEIFLYKLIIITVKIRLTAVKFKIICAIFQAEG